MIPVNAADSINITLFCVLLCDILGVSNIIFFPAYYKKCQAHRCRSRSAVAVFVFIGIEIMFCHALPLLKTSFDTSDP